LSSKKNKKNKSVQKQNKSELVKKSTELIYNKQQVPLFKYLLFLPLIITLIAGIYFVYSSYISNGYFGFPLDDPWIHLTFAKNLVDYGSFSYFRNEIVTSGSTSPIYTLVLSLFYIIIKNEFIISYLIGIIFGVFLIYMIIKISGIHFKDTGLLAIITALLVALQPKLNLINVSGMETSMFIFFVAGSFYAYQSKKMSLLGIFLGLTIWCRPDGFILWIAIALDYLLQKYYFKKNVLSPSEKNIQDKEIITAFSIALIFAGAYFLFNYLLSESILPNTYKAKLEYYQNNDRAQFLENEVLKYFSQDEFILIWIPFLIGIFGIVKSLFKKQKNTLLVYLLFIVGLIAIYYIKLPFAHRFGRYLMPVIPFYILTAVLGIKIIFDFISKRFVRRSNLLPNMIFIIYFIILAGMFINQNLKSLEEFTFFCKYHNDRHVAAGKWLGKNTNQSDVVATHDVGAIAFYSERKIIDIAGLITPELIEQVNQRSYSEYLNSYLANNKTDYIVTLKNWFEVVNDKPVFVLVNEFEFMEIYKYNPSRTHIQPKEVSHFNQAAIQMLQNGAASNALSYLNQSLMLDNRSSQTYFILGAVYEILKDYSKAEQNLKKAIEINSDYAEAYYGLAKINFDQNRIEESRNYLIKCLEINPAYSPAIQLLNQIKSVSKE